MQLNELSSYTKTLVEGALNGIDKCRNFISAECVNMEMLNSGDLAYHYVTQACELRSVTSADIKADVAKWERYEITAADRTRHSALIDDIDFCTSANSKDFRWRFRNPELKGCKKLKNK